MLDVSSPALADANSRVPAQEDLVTSMLALPGGAARRAFARRHAALWQPEAVALLKVRCDHLMGNQPRRAVTVARLACLVAEATGDAAALALADRALAQACHAAGHFALAVPLYERSAAAFDAAGQPAQAGGSRAALLDALARLGRYEEMLALAETTRAALMAIGEQRRVALIDANIGNGLLLMDRPREALAAYERAEPVFRRLDDGVSLAKLAGSRGNALIALARPQAAIVAFAEAVDRFEALDLAALAGQDRYNLAYTQLLMGRYAEALAGLETARRLFTAEDDRRFLALCLLDEAEAQWSLGATDEGGALAERARVALLRLGMRREAALAAALAARCLILAGRPAEAAAALAQARETFAAEKNMARLADIALIEARLLRRWDERTDALARCDDAIRLLAAVEHPVGRAEAFLLRGRALRALGRRGAATAARQALRAARAEGATSILWQAQHLLGQLHDKAGRHAQAAAAYRRAMAEVERRRAAIPTPDQRASFAAGQARLYADLALNALARGEADEAFSYVERAKSRALVDLLAGAGPPPGARDPAAAETAARIETGRGELAWIYNRIMRGEGGDRRAMLAEARRREAELERLLRRLRAGHAEYVSLRAVETIDLNAVQALLPAQTALLTFLCVDDDAYAFVVRSDGLVVRPLRGVLPAVARLLRRWQLHLGKYAYGRSFVEAHAASLAFTAQSILRGLYDALLRPLEPALGDAHLLVAPHGLLHGVPFQALHDGERHIIERREVSRIPSASVLRYCLARPARGDGYTLVVGVADERAPAIDREVDAVACLFADSQVLRDEEATIAAFRLRSAGAVRVHIAAHAAFRPDNPGASAIRLHDRWLMLQEVYELPLRACLVTLSGCATGAARADGGDEPIGLVRGFLYAGTPTVVAGMWALDDPAAAAWMTAFYALLLGGLTPRAALAQAQRQAIAAGMHPYYWAPFSVIGRP